MITASGHHLTYCTNIHPGESWAEVRAQLARHLPAVKVLVSPDRPFGVGLRLSDQAARALEDPPTLAEFRSFLADEGLYVFTINAFPFGAFHGTRVKDRVYRPDWREPARLAYSDACARVLAALLPDGVEGSVSTVPVGFKAHVAGGARLEDAADMLLRHAATLAGIARETGRSVALALEPEPCCVIETVEEAVAFFETHLFSAAAVRRFADLTGATNAEETLRRHLGLCLDSCHAAVEFEDADALLDRLAAAGIRIAKMQLSAGLVVKGPCAATRGALAPFAEDSYLHQVVERDRAGGLTRYEDLPDALARLPETPDGREWRIHFHVPIWAERLGTFASTRPFLERLLARHRAAPVSPHLEVETYTWDVLPAEHRGLSVEDAIARELLWVRQVLG